MMYVVGATHPEDLLKIRKIIPKHFLLVPGIGTQGGDLEGVLKNGLNDNYGLLINVSRDIIYASSDDDFDIKAGERARYYRDAMANIAWGKKSYL
jgi:orotidine-5'-phosphate decarboxylase